MGQEEKQDAEQQATSDKQQKGKRRIKVDEEEYHSLQDKAKRADALFDQLLRLQAEFENTRKRYLKEKEEYIRFAHGEMVLELLPVYDHFRIALTNLQAMPGEGANHGAMLQGIQMIQNEMWNLLSRNGLSRIETVGLPFNPEQHEALESVEADDSLEGMVIEEIRPGYLLNGKLLRPASVKVAKRKTQET
ncbi:MAG: nucleotide exchange factor GrpE [Candidatus Omnitrophica bacterium]|nr:nucleotide exchange factor GrpE [Candidatus Omnitrophota bacterium]